MNESTFGICGALIAATCAMVSVDAMASTTIIRVPPSVGDSMVTIPPNTGDQIVRPACWVEPQEKQIPAGNNLSPSVMGFGLLTNSLTKGSITAVDLAVRREPRVGC